MSSIRSLELQIEDLFNCKFLPEEEVKDLCTKAKELFIKEPNVQIVHCPITVCGDTHGQFHDLLELFKVGGNIPDTNYLFLGNYIDGGYFSVESISLLLALKLKYPNRIFLLRGTHESRKMSKIYGFYEECFKKYGNNPEIWKIFTDLFDFLPLCALIDNKILCLHGGLSPSIQTLEDINQLNRNQEIPDNSPISDLLWNDPSEVGDDQGIGKRTVGFWFGKEITSKFIFTNKLSVIFRRQFCQNGYQWNHDNNILSIFSAPNYCYRCGNLAAIVEIDDNMKYKLQTFEPAPRRGKTSLQKYIPDYIL